MTFENLYLYLAAAVTIVLMGLTYSALGDSGLGEDDIINNTTTVEECVEDSPYWVEQLYKLHFHEDGKTHLHIGVNVSLEEAAHNDGLHFRQLLIKKHQHKIVTGGNCRDGNHISHHAQFHGQICPWEYVCDYNPRRFPAHIFQAVCKNKYWLGADKSLHKCQQVYYPIATIHTQECNPVKATTHWDWRMEMVSVACA